MNQSIENSDPKKAFDLPSLSRKEAIVLEMLIESGRELFGLEMVEGSKGELKRGTIYVTLLRMSEKGYVESRAEPRSNPEIGIPRRLYKVTGYGQRVHAAYQMVRLSLLPDMTALGRWS